MERGGEKEGDGGGGRELTLGNVQLLERGNQSRQANDLISEQNARHVSPGNAVCFHSELFKTTSRETAWEGEEGGE